MSSTSGIGINPLPNADALGEACGMTADIRATTPNSDCIIRTVNAYYDRQFRRILADRPNRPVGAVAVFTIFQTW